VPGFGGRPPPGSGRAPPLRPRRARLGPIGSGCRLPLSGDSYRRWPARWPPAARTGRAGHPTDLGAAREGLFNTLAGLLELAGSAFGRSLRRVRCGWSGGHLAWRGPGAVGGVGLARGRHDPAQCRRLGASMSIVTQPVERLAQTLRPADPLMSSFADPPYRWARLRSTRCWRRCWKWVARHRRRARH